MALIRFGAIAEPALRVMDPGKGINL